MSERLTRVLIVDDAATVRATLVDILSSDPQLHVLGVAADPYEAAKLMEREAPDVILLDVEMPRMDGLTFLQKIMSQHPIPVVMCSSFTKEGSETALRALELGALEIIEKPRIGTRRFFEDSRMLICDVVKSAALARLAIGRARFTPVTTPLAVRPKLSADVILPSAQPVPNLQPTETVVVVGASTGGTEALRVFLQGFPEDAPGLVIVIHMPERFTKAYAERLDSLCHIRVKEAEDNDTVRPGLALLAPGNRHLLLKRNGARYYVSLHDGPFVSRHRPAVNVLFRSAARYGGSNVIGVLLTGMGDDGATGMRELKNAGAINLVQDEATCVVFGMPKEAIKTGAVDRVLPLERLAEEVLRRRQEAPKKT